MSFFDTQKYFTCVNLPTIFCFYLIFAPIIIAFYKTICTMNKIRSYDLDNLKVFLTVMVIFHHAGQAYGNGGCFG